jgi:hypothetical protein
MMPYLYDDEDNAPMNEENFVIKDIRPGLDGKPYVAHQFKSIEEASKYYKSLKDPDVPFSDLHDNGCWNCVQYDGDRCHYAWKHNDECYYNPETDDKDPDDWCPGWEIDENAIWEDYHETDSGCTMDP